MKKIAVIGCPGSGKSTLSVRLGQITGLPIFHLDDYYHTRTWNPADGKREWREFQNELVARPEWIIDGNYKGTLSIRVGAADTIVFLDFPRWLCVYRVLQRRLRQLCGRPAAGGNPERLEWSFLVFIWGYRTAERPKVLEMLRDKESAHLLKTPQEAETFIRSLSGPLEEPTR